MAATGVHEELLLPLLRSLAAGKTDLAIAHESNLTIEGLKSRLSRLYALLGATNRAHAVAIAYERGHLHPTHRAQLQHRDLADRHASTCALLRPPVCDCNPSGNGANRG